MATAADSDPGMGGLFGRRLRLAALIALALPAALLAGAYIGQYGFDLYPCEMCWWQRYPHFVAVALGALALLALARGSVGAARGASLLAGAAILVSGLIGAYHAGVEYGWWEGVTACTNLPQPTSSEDFWKTMMDMPVVRCDQAPFTLFGISLAGYNFIVSTLGALAVFRLATARERGPAPRVDEAGA